MAVSTRVFKRHMPSFPSSPHVGGPSYKLRLSGCARKDCRIVQRRPHCLLSVPHSSPPRRVHVSPPLPGVLFHVAETFLSFDVSTGLL